MKKLLSIIGFILITTFTYAQDCPRGGVNAGGTANHCDLFVGSSIDFSNVSTASVSLAVQLAVLPSQPGHSGEYLITNGSVASWGSPLSPTGVTPGTYEFVTVNANGLITGGYNSVTNNLAARTSSTAYQATNTSRSYDVDFTVSIAIGAGLISSSDGSVVLEISANGSTGWIEYSRSQNKNSGVLAAQNTQVAYIEAKNITAGYYYRLVFTQNSGTASWNYLEGHETLRR